MEIMRNACGYGAVMLTSIQSRSDHVIFLSEVCWYGIYLRLCNRNIFAMRLLIMINITVLVLSSCDISRQCHGGGWSF